MVNSSLAIVLIFILASCSSNKTSSEFKNEDFKKRKVYKYNKAKDHYSLGDKVQNDALNSETISHLNKDQVESIESEKDKILTISKLCHLGNLKEGLDLAASISDSYIKNPSYWNVIGVCHSLNKDVKKSILYFNKSLSLQGDYSAAYNNLGVMYKQSGQINKAAVALQKALKLNQYSKTAKYNLANLYLEYGLIRQSLELTEELLKISQHIDVLTLQAVAKSQLGDDQAALNIFEGIKDKIQNASAKMNYSLLLKKLNKSDDAKAILESIDSKDLNAQEKNFYSYAKNMVGVN